MSQPEVTAWRVHQDGKPRQWRYCEDRLCPEEHYLYRPFAGVDPDPIKDEQGKERLVFIDDFKPMVYFLVAVITIAAVAGLIVMLN